MSEAGDPNDEWWPHWEHYVPEQPSLPAKCCLISIECICHLVGLWFLAGSWFCQLGAWCLSGWTHGNLQRWVLVGLESAFVCASFVLIYILVGLVTTHVSAVATAVLLHFPAQTFLRVEIHVEFSLVSLSCAIWQSTSILVSCFAILVIWLILVALSWVQLLAFLLICGIVISRLKGGGM